jgi:hypothetical protein
MTSWLLPVKTELKGFSHRGYSAFHFLLTEGKPVSLMSIISLFDTHHLQFYVRLRNLNRYLH